MDNWKPRLPHDQRNAISVTYRNAFNPSLEVKNAGDICDAPGLAVEEDETDVEVILYQLTRSRSPEKDRHRRTT